jgi:plastocyanin
MQRTKLLALVTLLALAPVLAGCGSSSKSSNATITIRNFKFGSPLTVKVGTTVTVKNADTTAHTVTADDKSFDTGPISPGKTKTFAVTKAGTLRFHCDIHNFMTGSIRVTS